MNGRLLVQALFKFTLGAVVTGALLFLPAGTLHFCHGWLLIGLLFVPMFLAGLVMMVKNPELLRKRLDARESRGPQQKIIALSGLIFLIGFTLSGLGHRFGWPVLPGWVVALGCLLFLFSYAMYGEVLRENAYLSRNIRVQEGQKVVDTGLYGIVRHPMYAAASLLFLSMPLILGSLPVFLLFLLHPVLLASRILNEEQLLEEELDGYREYEKKVKYRLIPFVW